MLSFCFGVAAFSVCGDCESSTFSPILCNIGQLRFVNCRIKLVSKFMLLLLCVLGLWRLCFVEDVKVQAFQ